MNLKYCWRSPKSIVFFVLVGLHAEHALASPTRERMLMSPRAFGRGGTYAAAPESDEATRFNPATIAEPHKMGAQIRWFQGDLFMGSNVSDTIDKLTSIDPDDSPVAVLQKFNEKIGEMQYIRGQGSFGLRILYFDMMPFFSSTNSIDMRIPVSPQAHMVSDTRAGINLSFAYPLGKELYVGTTLRPFTRFLFDQELGFAEMMEFKPMGEKDPSDELELHTGGGLGFDMGFIYTPTKLTRFGLVMEDLGYTASGANIKPIPTYISAGFHTRFDFKPWHLDYALDMQDILNPEGHHALKLLHTGFEFGRNYLSRDHDIGVTLGLNEGYFSGGGFIDLYFFRFDVVSYAVELGEIPGQRPDRRTAYTFRSTLDI